MLAPIAAGRIAFLAAWCCLSIFLSVICGHADAATHTINVTAAVEGLAVNIFTQQVVLNPEVAFPDYGNPDSAYILTHFPPSSSTQARIVVAVNPGLCTEDAAGDWETVHAAGLPVPFGWFNVAQLTVAGPTNAVKVCGGIVASKLEVTLTADDNYFDMVNVRGPHRCRSTAPLLGGRCSVLGDPLTRVAINEATRPFVKLTNVSSAGPVSVTDRESVNATIAFASLRVELLHNLHTDWYLPLRMHISGYVGASIFVLDVRLSGMRADASGMAVEVSAVGLAPPAKLEIQKVNVTRRADDFIADADHRGTRGPNFADVFISCLTAPASVVIADVSTSTSVRLAASLPVSGRRRFRALEGSNDGPFASPTTAFPVTALGLHFRGLHIFFNEAPADSLIITRVESSITVADVPTTNSSGNGNTDTAAMAVTAVGVYVTHESDFIPRAFAASSGTAASPSTTMPSAGVYVTSVAATVALSGGSSGTAAYGLRPVVLGLDALRTSAVRLQHIEASAYASTQPVANTQPAQPMIAVHVAYAASLTVVDATALRHFAADTGAGDRGLVHVSGYATSAAFGSLQLNHVAASATCTGLWIALSQPLAPAALVLPEMSVLVSSVVHRAVAGSSSHLTSATSVAVIFNASAAVTDPTGRSTVAATAAQGPALMRLSDVRSPCVVLRIGSTAGTYAPGGSVTGFNAIDIVSSVLESDSSAACSTPAVLARGGGGVFGLNAPQLIDIGSRGIRVLDNTVHVRQQQSAHTTANVPPVRLMQLVATMAPGLTTNVTIHSNRVMAELALHCPRFAFVDFRRGSEAQPVDADAFGHVTVANNVVSVTQIGVNDTGVVATLPVLGIRGIDINSVRIDDLEFTTNTFDLFCPAMKEATAVEIAGAFIGRSIIVQQSTLSLTGGEAHGVVIANPELGDNASIVIDHNTFRAVSWTGSSTIGAAVLTGVGVTSKYLADSFNVTNNVFDLSQVKSHLQHSAETTNSMYKTLAIQSIVFDAIGGLRVYTVRNNTVAALAEYYEGSFFGIAMKVCSVMQLEVSDNVMTLRDTPTTAVNPKARAGFARAEALGVSLMAETMFVRRGYDRPEFHVATNTIDLRSRLRGVNGVGFQTGLFDALTKTSEYSLCDFREPLMRRTKTGPLYRFEANNVSLAATDPRVSWKESVSAIGLGLVPLDTFDWNVRRGYPTDALPTLESARNSVTIVAGNAGITEAGLFNNTPILALAMAGSVIGLETQMVRSINDTITMQCLGPQGAHLVRCVAFSNFGSLIVPAIVPTNMDIAGASVDVLSNGTALLVHSAGTPASPAIDLFVSWMISLGTTWTVSVGGDTTATLNAAEAASLVGVGELLPTTDGAAPSGTAAMVNTWLLLGGSAGPIALFVDTLKQPSLVTVGKVGATSALVFLGDGITVGDSQQGSQLTMVRPVFSAFERGTSAGQSVLTIGCIQRAPGRSFLRLVERTPTTNASDVLRLAGFTAPATIETCGTLTPTITESRSPTAATATRSAPTSSASPSLAVAPTGTLNGTQTPTVPLPPTATRELSASRTVVAATPACAFATYTVGVRHSSVPPDGGSSAGAAVLVAAADINRDVSAAAGAVQLLVLPGGGGAHDRFTSGVVVTAVAVSGPDGQRRAERPAAGGLAAQWGRLATWRVLGNGTLLIALGGGGGGGSAARVALVEREYVRVAFSAAGFACEVPEAASRGGEGGGDDGSAGAAAPGVPTAIVLEVRPEPLPALAVAEAAATVAATSTVAVAAASGSAAAAGDAQALAVLALVQCGSAAGRATSGRMAFLLSLVPLGSAGLEPGERAVLGNVALLAGVAALQLAAAAGLRAFGRARGSAAFGSWAGCLGPVRFPGLLLVGAQLQLPGTAVHAVSLVLRGSVGAVALLGLAVALATPAAVHAATRRAVRASFTGRGGGGGGGGAGAGGATAAAAPSASGGGLRFMAYTRAARLLPFGTAPGGVGGRVWALVGPCARWGPKVPSQMFGAPVRQLRAAWAGLAAGPSVQALLFAVVAAMPVPSGWLCSAQFGALAVVGLGLPAACAVAQPYRIRALAGLRLASAVALAAALAVSAALAGASADGEDGNGGGAPAPAALFALSAAVAALTLIAVAQAGVTLGVKVLERVYLGEDAQEVPYLEGRGFHQPGGAATEAAAARAKVALAELMGRDEDDDDGDHAAVAVEMRPRCHK